MRENKALILYDAAYVAFIRDASLPQSIYEIDGAPDVAVEFRSFSKTAGFTGTRCAYTVIPKQCKIYDSQGGMDIHCMRCGIDAIPPSSTACRTLSNVPPKPCIRPKGNSRFVS